ncbi:MAG: hypothetical protein ACHQIM_09655 [Sphingobacteriales bacterium]
MKKQTANSRTTISKGDLQIVKGVSPAKAKRKVRLGGPITGSGPGLHPNFGYQGGPIIPNPQVYTIYLGDWTSLANVARANNLDQFITDLMNSDYMNMLSQYGTGSTGTFVQRVIIPNANNSLLRADLDTILQNAIDTNKIPEPTNPSNAYIVIFDDAMGMNDVPTNNILCEANNDNAFGFHDVYNTNAHNNLFFAIIPGLTNTCLTNSCPGNDGGCSLHLAQTQEQRQTQVISHEFTEMITDPLNNSAWVEPFVAENGDICNGNSGNITVGPRTWNVQQMYSKWDDMQSNGATICVLGSPFPLPSLLPACAVNIDKSSYGKDEVDAFINGPTHSPAVFDAAFYVVADGFTANALGISAISFTGTPNVFPNISPAPGITGMSFTATALSAPDQTQFDIIQPFTWVFRVSFSSDSSFPTTPGSTIPVTLTATVTSVSGPALHASGSADIELIDEPNPFEQDGPVSWLSTDLRVFQINAGDSKFGEMMGTTPADAITFIQNVIHRLNTGNTAGQTFENNISIDETASHLELSEKVGGIPVFNFGIAKVHYRSLATDSGTVRVFFRLFPGSTTSTAYDGSTYPRGGQGGVIIPLPGVVGGETTTIPCFADARLDYSVDSINAQTDSKNVQVIDHDPSGNERIAYFGCWLDINQPNQKLFPISPPNNTGPYNAADQLSIQDLVRNIHQCLVSEISLDGVTLINNGETPGSSDKLAQRNLTIVQSANPGSPASHRIPSTFEIKRSAINAKSAHSVDELLVDFQNIPAGSTASFYMPGANPAHIIDLANSLYSRHNLTLADPDTLQLPARGIAYIPVPQGTGPNFAGLLTIDLPATVKKGQFFKVIVRQLTAASGRLIVPVPVPQLKSPAAEIIPVIKWKKVTGSFQVSIPVTVKELMLGNEERLLSVLRWIQKSVPAANRWYPVFNKYVGNIADRVKDLGGNPDLVLPSPAGEWQKPKEPHGEKRISFYGKISGLKYDRFGDFEGFFLDTEDREHYFMAHEPALEELCSRAWEERIRIKVTVDSDDPHFPHRPDSIVLIR